MSCASLPATAVATKETRERTLSRPAHLRSSLRPQILHRRERMRLRLRAPPLRAAGRSWRRSSNCFNEIGATIDELIDATGWLPHTTRAALTGLRKRGFALAIDRSEKKRGSIYRIEKDLAAENSAATRSDV